MNKYRIIKRKNSVFKDQDEYVVQQEVYNQYRNTSLSLQAVSDYYWSNLSTFSTLAEAQADKHKRETGLNPGETIVG